MTRSDGFDAVVVGSGPNGLVAAVTMAEAGYRVLVVEASARFGGGLRTEELTLSGFRHDTCASVLPLALASRAFRGLDLERDGLRWAHPPVPAAHPLDDQPAVLVHRELERTVQALGPDGRAWHGAVGVTARAGARLVDTLLAPLDLPPGAPLAAIRYGALGLWPATTLARIAFSRDPARAVLAGMAAHSMLDLRAPLTAGFGLLLAALAHQVGWPVVQGGSQALTDVLVDRVRKRGGEVVGGQVVRDLGELPDAPVVLLDLTPRQVVAVAGDRLPASYRRRLERYRYGPGVFKVDWALDGPVPWSDPGVATAGTVHLGGRIEEIAHSEAEVARGRHPDRPYVLLVQPCVADPTRAPEGSHTLWAYCHVPNGSDLDRTEAIEAQIERFAPGFTDRVLARHTMRPTELEAHNANLVGGDIGGGSARWTQFLGRPVYARRPWQTPVPGLFLCSAATPPGAGVHGMGGYQAARLALQHLDQRARAVR